MEINWDHMFMPATSLVECFLRGSIIYLSLFFIFRFMTPRVGGNLSMGDVLVVVLIADGVQNGMSGEIRSVTEALVVAVAIIFWDFMIELAAYYCKPLRLILEPPPLLIVQDGKPLKKNLRKQFLTEDELESKMRLNGIERMEEIKEAYLEDDGHISFILKKRS